MKKGKIFAALLASAVMGLTAAMPASAADAGWNRDSAGWWYSSAVGGYEQDGWSRIDGQWYYFDAAGYMQTGWVQDGGSWYYLTSSGAMKTGWLYEGGSWYYLDGSGKMLADTLLELGGSSYYLGAAGAMFVGERTVDGRTMRFGSDGALITEEQPAETNDVLVVYYSATGSTEAAAGYIADAAGGDIFELLPVRPYTSADLDWAAAGSRVNREHDNESLREVALTADTVENWDEYDTVFIGYPIWWGIAAWPVNSFVEANDFTGKTVIPFCTSSSSGLGQSGELLEEMAGSGEWLEGRRFPSNVSQETVEAWVESLNLSK